MVFRAFFFAILSVVAVGYEWNRSIATFDIVSLKIAISSWFGTVGEYDVRQAIQIGSLQTILLCKPNLIPP